MFPNLLTKRVWLFCEKFVFHEGGGYNFPHAGVHVRALRDIVHEFSDLANQAVERKTQLDFQIAVEL